MMNNLRNHVQLIGHLGKDAEVFKFDKGGMKATVSIATNESYKNEKGERVEKTSWHRVAGWGKTAEIMEKYFTKGKEVMISGKLTYHSYKDKNGTERTTTEIVISEFTFLGKNKKAA